MIAPFAPEICRLVEDLTRVIEGRLAPDDVLEALADACEVHTRSRHRARVVAACVPERAEQCQRLEGLFEEREALLGKLEGQLRSRAALVPLTVKLQELSYHIVGLGREIERGRRAEAPHPALDEAIKLARAVAEGRAPTLFLRVRVEELVELHDRLESELKLFWRFYSQKELGKDALEALQAGVGAIVEDEAAEAARLLTEAGRLLARTWPQLKAVRDRDGFSAVAVLDTLGQLARKAPEELPAHLEVVKAWHQGLGPPDFPDPAYEKEVLPVWERFRKARDPREQLRLGNELARKHAAWKPTLRRSFYRDPLWEDLRDALLGWHVHVVPLPTVVALLEKVLQVAENVELQLAALPVSERPPLLAAVRGPAQPLARLLESRERSAAPAAVQTLEDSFDRWLWARDAVKAIPVPAPGPAALAARLRLVRGESRTLGNLRTLLEATRKTAAQADLPACRQLEETLGELLENSDDETPTEDLAEVLNHAFSLLDELAENA